MKTSWSTFLTIILLNILSFLSIAKNSDTEFVKIVSDCSNPVNAILGSNQIANYNTGENYYSIITMPKTGKFFISSLNENAADIKIYRDNCGPENLVGTKLKGFGSTAQLESTLFAEGTVILIEWTFQQKNYTNFNWDLSIEEWNSINQSCSNATQAFPFFSNSNFIPDPQPNNSYYFYFSPGFFENPSNGRFSIKSISEVDGVQIKVHNSSQCPNNEFGISNNGYLLTSELTATVVKIEFSFPSTVSIENFEWTFDFVLSSELSSQEISFNELPTKQYGDEDFMLQATSSANLPITYESLTPETASISGNVVSIHGAGEVTMRAIQNGDARVGFLPATPVEQVLVIQKANLNIIPIADTIVYGSTIPGFKVIYEGFINNDDRNDLDIAPNIVTNAIQGSEVGNYIISTEGGLDSDYYFTYFTDTLVIQQASQNISFDSIPDKNVFDDDFEVIANVDSGLDLAFEILSGPATIEGNILSLTGVIGTIELKISQEGNSNYFAAEVVTFIKINKANQTITIDSIETKTTTNTPFTVNATVNSGLPLAYELISGPATIEGNVISVNGNNGTIELRISQEGDSSYYPTELVTFINVIKTDQIITVDSIEAKTTTNAPFTVNATVNSGLPLAYEIVSGPATIEENVISVNGNNGTIELRISQEGDSSYYPTELVTFINVIKTDQIITVDSIETKTTTNAPFTVNATVNSGLPLAYEIISGPATINDDTISLNGSIGTVELLLSQAGNEVYSNVELSIKFEVIIDPCLNLNIKNIIIKDVSCFGESDGSIDLEMLGTAPFQFSVNNGEYSETNNFDDLSAGTFLIEIKDANDCSMDTLLTINQPNQVIIESVITPSTTFDGNGEIDISIIGEDGNYTFLWSNGETSEDLKELIPGEYSLIISDSNKCEDIFQFTVGGVTPIKSDNYRSSKIYPNPVNTHLFIEFKQRNNLSRTITIYDKYGKIIKEEITSNNQIMINLEGINSGVYYMQIDKEKDIRKIVKN